MGDIIATEPAKEPVTTAEAKSHMYVDTADDNDLIDTYIKSARVNIEALTGLKFISQEWKMTLDEFPADDFIKLQYGPIISVDEIKTIDADDVDAVFSSDDYRTDLVNIPAKIKLRDGESWTDPAAGYRIVNGVEIKYTAGYGTDASDVPEPLKLAIKLLVAHFYMNREATTIANINALPMGIASLISPYRTWQREI